LVRHTTWSQLVTARLLVFLSFTFSPVFSWLGLGFRPSYGCYRSDRNLSTKIIYGSPQWLPGLVPCSSSCLNRHGQCQGTKSTTLQGMWRTWTSLKRGEGRLG
jgi:hypothetical protein